MSRGTGRKGVLMPRGDGTGPMGTRPRKGRGTGYCAGYAKAGYVNPVRPLVDSKTEIEILRRQVANIENELQAIRDRLAKISEKH
jgi:hypothetical protein